MGFQNNSWGVGQTYTWQSATSATVLIPTSVRHNELVILPAINTSPTQTVFPNLFTPNNDGKNDVYMVFSNVIQTMRLVIFNQWGGEGV
ncbi:hypothetical protein A4D02_14535 [Niastella koreensis]|uniref:Uncharacterized protein n=1 Tax=Niastella koreensis TaxID=354356 RepID=A0ABX3NN33_9BACT|nr:gliding motility-associated C-terminal domain-containing protein [Niastella koreensis]OQP40146.1 hypothetical protein A4D02_14535 [Niastella koreensis]